jgi:para-nitrobenzyl esterase
VLGWFRHAALRAATTDSDEQSGNFGTRDLVCALRWVRDNIAAFRRRPGERHDLRRIGRRRGTSISLLASERAATLFHRAIAQSGTPETFGVDEAENLVDEDPPGAEKSSGEVLLELLIQDGGASGRDAAKTYASRMSARGDRTVPASKTFLELDQRDLGLEAAFRGSGVGAASISAVFRDGSVLAARWDHGGAVETGRSQPRARDSWYHPRRIHRPIAADQRYIARATVRRRFRIQDPGTRQRYAIVAEYLAKLLKAYAVDEPAEAMRRHWPRDVVL